MNQPWRLIFMGTPLFAQASLQSLINSPSFQVVSVFTQADKPVGRKQKLSPSPIKKLAAQYQLPIFQPLKIKEAVEIIKNYQPDLIVVVAYGQIIPPSILDLPKFACLNVHASLLPKYRGAACLAAPILNGDQETGITIMKMDVGLDTGPILHQEIIKLNGQETWLDLHNNLAQLSAQILPTVLKDYCQGKIKPQAQNDQAATYVKLTKKNDGKINWQNSALIIDRQIRALNPWPGTYSHWSGGQNLKIIKAIISDDQSPLQAGEMKNQAGQLLIGSGQGNLQILELQMAGKKIVTAQAFLRGHQVDGLILE